MKTSSWIKLIGILCIVFGAQGIINTILPLMLHGMNGIQKKELPEVSPDQLTLVLKLPYIAIFANIIYLIAGIFFLIKKPFSLIIIYTALTLSILCRIVPMLIISQYSSGSFSDYEINVFILIGPLIDVSLLIGVYRLSKYYYNPDDELIKLFGECTLTPLLRKIFTLAGLVCISIPVSIQGLWIYAANSGTNQAKRVAAYHSYFPDFLQGQYALNYLSIAFCLLAIIISAINLKSSGIIEKLNMIILVFGCLLLFLNLFQMM
jgi:hypothetical protein